jgi:phenylalanyl-tRNA synthetase beta subunit
MKFSYNWLKWYIPEAPEPQKIVDTLMHHLTEVEGVESLPDGDTLIDVNILPNRAHDLLSHSGLARELAGQLALTFTDPTKTYTDIVSKKEIQKTELTIDIQTNNCRRYSARIIRNIKIGPSPEWVVKHLESVGQRSINNIVDATNLVMLNCGQPTHAFDLRKFTDKRIYIKNAKNDEDLELVGKDKIVAKLKDTDIVVLNSSEETLALAGVKGGTNSGIQDDTTDIVLEVANFDPVAIRKTARRIGVLSDAAKRFENDLSPELCGFGMLELSALISEMCPDAVFEDVIDVYPESVVFKNKKCLSVNSSYVNKKIGSNLTDDDVEKIFKNYNFEYSKDEKNDFTVTVPFLRLDLLNKEDLVEEIGRIYGYEKILPVMPKIDFLAKDNPVYTKIQNIRNALVNNGYKEVMTYSLAKKGSVELARAAKGKDFLRNDISSGLKDSYELNRLNAPLFADTETKIFEIGSTFAGGVEEIHVAMADKKGVRESTLDEFLASGEFNLLESLNDIDSSFVVEQKFQNKFEIWSPYPLITRDISVWVPEDFNKEDLVGIYTNAGGSLLAVSPYLVDMFTKDGRTSYAYRLVFQSKDRTLESDEVSAIVEKINQELQKIQGLEIR